MMTLPVSSHIHPAWFYILMTKVTYTFTDVCRCHHVSLVLSTCVFTSRMNASYACLTSIALLIINVCSTCRDACQLCTDTSHLLCFLSAHSFCPRCISLSHTCTYMFSTIHSWSKSPWFYRLNPEALCQSVA